MRKQNSKQISANNAKRFRIWLKCETFVLLQLFVVASVVYCTAIIVCVCVMRYRCMSCFGYGWVGDIIAIVWVNVRGRLPAQMQHDFCDAFVCVFSIIVCSLGVCVYWFRFDVCYTYKIIAHFAFVNWIRVLTSVLTLCYIHAAMRYVCQHANLYCFCCG